MVALDECCRSNHAFLLSFCSGFFFSHYHGLIVETKTVLLKLCLFLISDVMGLNAIY